MSRQNPSGSTHLRLPGTPLSFFLHSRAKLWSGGGGTGFLQTWPDTDKREIFLTRGVSCSHGLLTFRVDGLGVVRVYILCACPYDMC